MYEIEKMPNAIDIGFTGETMFREIKIDMAKWMVQMPNGVPSIVHIRPGETKADAYIAATTFTNNVLTWPVTEADLGAREGTGMMQIWLEEEENDSIIKRGKSILVVTRINGAIDDATSEIPEPQESWLEQMTALKVATVDAAADAEAAAAAAEEATVHEPRISSVTENWETWDTETESYVDTGNPSRGEQGDKGDEPVITGSKSGKTTTISADGVPIATILDGDDGDPTVLIDDTAGSGDTGKTWSADKLASGFAAKANKASSATSGHLAGLDSGGNVTDSGSKPADFVASNQGSEYYGKILGIGHDGDVVPVDQEGGGAAAMCLSLTLLANGWNGATPPLQTLTATGVTASGTDVIVSLGPGATNAQYEAAGAARIKCTSQGENSLTFTAVNGAPSVDIPLSVFVAIEEPVPANGVSF